MRLCLLRWSEVRLAAVLVFGAISISAHLQLPALIGLYAVGRTLLRWVDTSRLETLSRKPTITTRWWPTSGIGDGFGRGWKFTVAYRSVVRAVQIRKRRPIVGVSEPVARRYFVVYLTAHRLSSSMSGVP